ncbi:MAG: hypothetical protein R3Y27_05835, partial [Clostridia bacterium]
RKKENAIFLVTFFGQAKKRNAPAAAETALTASTKVNIKRKFIHNNKRKNGRKINQYANAKTITQNPNHYIINEIAKMGNKEE